MADGFTDGGGWRRIFPAFTFTLIAVNIAIYALTEWIHWHSRFPADWYLALHEDGLKRGYIWEFITFQFLHAHLMHPPSWAMFARLDLPWHLILNCWTIFVFGPPLEAALGRTRLTILYFLSGMGGGALQIFAGLISSQHFGGMVAGASAGVLGMVAAFTTIFPNARMTLLLFFVIPLQMTANRMLTFAAVLTVLGLLFARMFPDWLLGANVAHAAHLGGLITGLILTRFFRATIAGNISTTESLTCGRDPSNNTRDT